MAPRETSLIGTLGRAARAGRALGLDGAVAAVCDAGDAAFLRAGRPPLRASHEGVAVRGYLRHRSYLADVAAGVRGGYTHLLPAALEPGATLVDGGAHVGLYSLLGARVVGAGGRVLAFEPDPYNFRALEWNAQRAAGARVELWRSALADAPGTAAFHESRGTISGSLVDRSSGAPTRRVEVTTVDAALAGAPLGRLVVKLNVEGAEPLALEGLRESARRAGSVRLFVEVNPAALDAAGSSAAGLFARLRGLGLELAYVDPEDESLHAVDAATAVRKGHLLCARG